MDTFARLGVLPAFVEKLAEKSVSVPTTVQRLAVPPLLEGRSIIFRSATGTGKTFAYLVPVLQRITAGLENGASATGAAGPMLLVCAPTIELCSQIKTEIDFLSGGQWASVLLIGSMNVKRQIDSLKKSKPLAVVGNPGRLFMLADMGKLKLKGLRFVVFDEADRLTASDSREDTRSLVRIINRFTSPPVEFEWPESGTSGSSLVTAACSATVSEKIKEYLSPLLDGAVFLETDEQEILRERIEHWAIFSESRRKTQMLISFLAAVKPRKTLVFSSRTHDVGKIASILQSHAVKAAGLYGGMDKQERKSALDRFRSGKTAVLVSSDLAARGLDIPGITHVVALDLGEAPDAYIHRAGRTGRAGKHGVMLTIGDEMEMRRLAALEKKLGIVVYPRELRGGLIGAIPPL